MMKEHKEGSLPLCTFLVRMLQGMLIGLGAVLPGISGGVLCVIFGIYRPVMELLSNPRKYFFTHIRKLLPVILGGAVGFLGVANILSFFLEKYPDPSVCLFVGLIAGMLPSLMREAGKEGRTNGSWISMVAAAVVILAILTTLNLLSVSPCAECRMVRFLRRVSGIERDCSGNEFFYPSDASGIVYSVC